MPPDQNPPGKRYRSGNGMGVTTGTDGIRQQHTVQPGGMTPSPGRSDTPPRFIMKSGACGACSRQLASDTPRCGRKTHHQVSREAQARQVFQFITGLGPVVSWEPTEVIFGSQYAPDECLSRHRHGLPFSAPARSRIALSDIFRLTEHITMRQAKSSRALVVRPRPIISGIRPPAALHQSARRFSVRRLPAVRRFVVTHFTFVRVNVNYVAHVQVETSTSIGSAPASSIVLKKIVQFYRRGTNHRRVCSAHVEYIAHKPQNGVRGGFTR